MSRSGWKQPQCCRGRRQQQQPCELSVSNQCSHSSTGGLIWLVGSYRDVPQRVEAAPVLHQKDRTQSRTQSVGCSRFFWYRLVAAPVLQERKGSSSSSQPHDHINWCSHSSTGGLVWPVGSSRDVPQRIIRFQWKPQCCRKKQNTKNAAQLSQ